MRAGRLAIGSKDAPFPGEAKITLFGEKENQNIVYDNYIEAGNKVLAITSKVELYGKQRNGRSRLTQSIQ